jgi:hypothetical protein
MPSEAFLRMIERAVSDEEFAARLQTDIEGAIAEFDLTEEEKQALLARDVAQLQALGVDERISKRTGRAGTCYIVPVK